MKILSRFFFWFFTLILIFWYNLLTKKNPLMALLKIITHQYSFCIFIINFSFLLMSDWCPSLALTHFFKYSFSAIYKSVSPLWLSSKSLLLIHKRFPMGFEKKKNIKWMRQEWRGKMNLDGNNCKWAYLIAQRKIHKYDNVSISVIHQKMTTELSIRLFFLSKNSI